MEKGRVINLCGGVYKVLMEDGTIKTLKARGKLRQEKVIQANIKSQSKKEDVTYIKNSPKVGDIAYIDNDMISSFEKRKNELVRPDIANVDQILLIFSDKEPDFSFYLLDLFIVNIVKQKIKPVIVITKIDKLLDEELLDLKNKMNYYKEMGYDVLFISSLKNIGIEDYFTKKGVCIIEWSDLIEDILPKNRLDIKIKIIDENTRQFVITPHGNKYEDLCERVL